jgi:hypothetical protein
MKITLSFPKGPSDQHRPEVEAEVSVIPRKGELLSWNHSTNFKVEDVVHQVTGRDDDDDDNEASHRAIVWLE